MALLADVDAAVRCKRLLDHPFYLRWSSGALPLERIQAYACAYYAFESNLPQFHSALHARCDDPLARLLLLQNLWDEVHGSHSHAELWLMFAEVLGLKRREVRAAPWSSATTRLVEFHREMVTSKPVGAGLGAMYAYESQVPEVARVKAQALREHYEVSDEGWRGLSQRRFPRDVELAEAERLLILSLPSDEATYVLPGVTVALRAWWEFLDQFEPSPLTL